LDLSGLSALKYNHYVLSSFFFYFFLFFLLLFNLLIYFYVLFEMLINACHLGFYTHNMFQLSVKVEENKTHCEYIEIVMMKLDNNRKYFFVK